MARGDARRKLNGCGWEGWGTQIFDFFVDVYCRIALYKTYISTLIFIGLWKARNNRRPNQKCSYI